MASWQEVLAPFVRDVEKRFDRLKYRLGYALGGPDPIKIVPFRGYGTPERLYLKGRVLEDPGIEPATDSDSLWDNLLNMYRRIESDEVPHARLVARFQGVEQEVQADEEGMFELWIAPSHPTRPDGLWHYVELELLEPQSEKQEGPVRATAEVLIPPLDARFVVVSDIDDTVVQSDVANVLLMARHVFLGNARTRLPFPGVAAFYRALHAGTNGDDFNPLLYVSNNLWNLYDLLSDFFQLHGIPVGPVIQLRNWGIYVDELLPTQQRKHKLPAIRQMVETYADLPFILIGDSGEVDPEIYYDIVQQYPERVLAVYIRNVSRDLKRPEAIRALAEKVAEAGSTLILADDSLAMAKHAVKQGWIAPQALPAIAQEKEKDEGPPGRLEELLRRTPKQEGPTVRVEGQEPEEIEAAVETGAIESALEAGDARHEETPTVIVERKDEEGE
jgi:phosphatidate phosphatase APP1